MLKTVSKRFVAIGAVMACSFFLVGENIDEGAFSNAHLNIKPPASIVSKIEPDFGRIPLYFIPNLGQVDQNVRFYARTALYTLWITNDGLIFDNKGRIESDAGEEEAGNLTRFVFLGANNNPDIIAINETSHAVNYLKGRDRSRWQTGLRTSQGVLIKNIYPRIDLKIYGIERQIEYDWIIKPGADPASIRFQYCSIENTTLDSEGNIIIETGFGRSRHHRPVTFQVINGRKVPVKAEFEKVGDNTYGFRIDEYNKKLPLVIDPIVTVDYSTYLGGTLGDYGYGITVDEKGCAYITGFTASTNFPARGHSLQGAYGGGNWDIFIMKLSPNGKELVYSTYFGGNGDEHSWGIEVDVHGCAYVTGDTNSANFPLEKPFQGVYGGGDWDAFVTKVSPNGDALMYSTYLGGKDIDGGLDIAVNPDGNAFLTGYTVSNNFPVKNAAQGRFAGGGNDAFVVRLSTSGERIDYSTYLGGNNEDAGWGIDIDPLGSAYITGSTSSADFPTLNAFQRIFGGYWDAFVTKLSPKGNKMVYSTYMGGTFDDEGYGIDVDGGGNAYVTGYTYSANFPVKNGCQKSMGGRRDAFVTHLSPSGSAVVYSTFIGGSSSDLGYDIAVDRQGNAFITGYTLSTDFPTRNAYQDTFGGSWDAFVTQVAKGGTTILNSTYFRGSDSEVGRGIALDSEGNVYVAGQTKSTDFPTHNPFQGYLSAGYDAFVSKITFTGDFAAISTTVNDWDFFVNSSGEFRWR